MLRFMDHHYATGLGDVRVRIHHLRSEGYPPSAEGLEIKEELSLREFLTRIMTAERNVENELYRVSKAIAARDNNQIEMICEKYNDMYIHLIRSGRAVLAQHRMSGIGGHFGLDPFDNKHRGQMSNRDSSREYERQAMMQQMGTSPMYRSHGILDPGPSQAEKSLALKKSKLAEEKKKRDDDLFYLTI